VSEGGKIDELMTRLVAMRRKDSWRRRRIEGETVCRRLVCRRLVCGRLVCRRSDKWGNNTVLVDLYIV